MTTKIIINKRNSVHPIETQKSKHGSKEKTQINDDPNDFSQYYNIPNEELSYRCTNIRLKGLNRIYSYFNAPIIKFLNHFVKLLPLFISKAQCRFLVIIFEF